MLAESKIFQNSTKDRTTYVNISVAAKDRIDNNNKFCARKFTVEKFSLVLIKFQFYFFNC